MYTTKPYAPIVEGIRNKDFREHKATLQRFGPITVIDWRRPNTGAYAMRYVCDGNFVFITGDLGTAVFDLTWQADEHAFDGRTLAYLHEKLETSSEPDRAMEFDPAHAEESIHVHYADAADQYMVGFCAENASCCFDLRDWHEWLAQNGKKLEKRMDANWFETLPNIGSVYCQRFLLWVTGLQMASEQLRQKEKEENT